MALVAVLVAILATAAVAGWFVDEPAAEMEGCPRLPDKRAFTGESYGPGAVVRSGASETERLVRTIPSNCTIGFTGFCIGAKTRDSTSGTPDIRWFILPDGNVVPSGTIHGNPPADLRPARCRNDRPGPAGISLVLTADPTTPGAILARATGDNLEIVGFAARTGAPAGGDAPQWRQLGLSGGAEFSGVWRPTPSAQTGPVTIVAVACLGGGRPTEVVDARAVPASDPVAAQPSTLGPKELTAAARSACQYPARR